MTTAVMPVERATARASVPAVAAAPTHLIRARSTNPGNVLVSRDERGTINHLFPVTEVHEFTDRTGDRTALVVCENGTFAFSRGHVIEIAGLRPARFRRVKR